MTVKELAEFTGKNKSTICRWIAKTQIDSITSALQNATQYSPANYDIDEIESILKSGSMSKDAVRILMDNARKPAESLELVSAPNQMDVLFAFMERQQQVNQQFMTTVLSELKGFREKPLQIESIKQDYYSIKGYNNLMKLKLTYSECLIHGKKLSSLSKEKGIEIHKVSDERFGQVNSYNLDILDEYFSV